MCFPRLSAIDWNVDMIKFGRTCNAKGDTYWISFWYISQSHSLIQGATSGWARSFCTGNVSVPCKELK